MAIGENYTNNRGGNSNEGGNKLFEQTYYSRCRLKNESEGRALNIQFSRGLLRIDIEDILEGFKYDTKISIYLSPTKCNILSKQLEEFDAYVAGGKIDKNKAFGVNAGMKEKITFIAFHAEDDMTTVVTIGTFDGNGTIIDIYDFKFNTNYHYGLNWNNLSSNDLEKNYVNGIEYEMIKATIADFGRYMNGALAYSVADLTRYDSARILRKMDPIYDALHIERYSGNGGGYNRGGSNSFLNNTKSSSRTIDDIEEDFMD